MPTIIDSFLVTLGLDPSNYNEGQGKVRDQNNKTKDQLAKSAKDTEAWAKKSKQAFNSLKLEAFATLAALAGANSLKQFVGNLITTDAAVGRLSHNLGVSTEELSAWQGVVRSMGGTSEDASAGLQTLVDLYTKLRLGTLSASEAGILTRLGVTAEDLKDPTRAALKLADAFQKMDPRLASEFGKQLGFTPAMINTLEKGRDKITEMLVEQKKLGVVTQEDADKAIEFERRISALKTSVQGLGRAIVTDLLPGLTALLDGITAFLSDKRGSPSDAAKNQFWADVFAGRWDKLGADNAALDASRNAPGGGGGGGGGGGAGGAGAPGGGGPGPKTGGTSTDRFNQTVQFFKDRGWPDAAARGMAAGFFAESNGIDPEAFNPAGGGQGAYGIGQWRGARLAELRRRYGMHPTLYQQLEFAQWELTTKGPLSQRRAGANIYGSKTAEQALGYHIRQYEAPAAGPDTDNDIARGRRALARGGGGATPASTTVNVNGPITIHTKATDARGIATSFHAELATQANTGLA